MKNRADEVESALKGVSEERYFYSRRIFNKPDSEERANAEKIIYQLIEVENNLRACLQKLNVINELYY